MCTCNSRTLETALKPESWGELQTVGQKGSYGKQAHQINPRTINTKMEACNLAFYVHILKGKIVSFETYSKNTKKRISVISKLLLKKKRLEKLSIQKNLYLCC